MSDLPIKGTWVLTETLAIDDEIRLIGEELEPGAVDAWLSGDSDDRLDQLESADGLRLTIWEDGTFMEEKIGAPKITWFDSEGVMDSEVMPFGGRIFFVDGRGYLTLPDAQPLEKIRYDDGDTKICDSVTFIDGKLVRTVSVVTDELYLNRVLLRYEKEG